MIVALEGPCLAGKTTVTSQLLKLLAARKPLAFPCYVAELAVPAPDPVAPTRDEQLAATKLFLQVETQRFARVRLAAPELVVLDRSVDTLAAHALGVSRYPGGSDGYFDTLAVIGAESRKLVPDLTLFLVVPHAELLVRSSSFPHLPPVYYDPAFLSGFTDHFKRSERFARELVFVDALGDPTTIASHILAEIEKRSIQRSP